MRVGMALVVRPSIYSDKHTSTYEEIKILPPIVSERANFHLRFMKPLPCLPTHCSVTQEIQRLSYNFHNMLDFLKLLLRSDNKQ